MSKQVNQSSLGTNFLISGLPASADEFDEMAGEAGACVAAANDDYIKHNWLSKFRTKFIPALAEATGVERVQVGERKTKSGSTPIYEKDTAFIERVEAEKGDMSQFNELAQQVADTIPVDLSGSLSGGRIGKAYLEAAEEFIEKVANAGGDFSKFVDYITSNNPGFQFIFDDEGNPAKESIAFALKADEERVRKAAAANVASLV